MKIKWTVVVLIGLVLGVALFALPFLDCNSANDSPQCRASWLTAVGTLALAILVVFQDRIRNLLMRPKLKISYTHTPPLALLTFWRSPKDPELREPVFYFRFRVVNNGESQARRCEAVLEDLWVCDTVGNPVKLPNFSPVSLRWLGTTETFFDINPDRRVYCNIGHISSPDYQGREERDSRQFVDIPGYSGDDLRFVLDQSRVYFSQPNCLPPGKYIIKIAIYSENASYQEICFEIAWSGNWKDSEKDMFREIVIRPVDHP